MILIPPAEYAASINVSLNMTDRTIQMVRDFLSERRCPDNYIADVLKEWSKIHTAS